MHLKRVVVQVDWTRFGFVVFGIVRFAEFALKIAVYQSVLVVAVGDIAAVVVGVGDIAAVVEADAAVAAVAAAAAAAVVVAVVVVGVGHRVLLSLIVGREPVGSGGFGSFVVEDLCERCRF